jgi:hypothetical protein
MLTRTTAWYEARIIFGLASLLPLLILPGYMLIGGIVWTSRQAVPPLQEIITVFEVVLTLAGGLACAHLMTIEREEGFDEMRRTYPEPVWRVPLLRATEAAALILFSGMLAALLFSFAYGQYDVNQVVLPAFAPALYLAGLALLISNVSGSYWIAAGVIVGYWYGDLLSHGTYTQILFLFNHSTPLTSLDPALNRALLIGGALVFFTLNAGYSAWRRRGYVGR